MLPITAYADRYSVAPGETIAFKVSSVASEDYEARLVRVICGDPNPAGPGMREQPVDAAFAGRYPSRFAADPQRLVCPGRGNRTPGRPSKLHGDGDHLAYPAGPRPPTGPGVTGRYRQRRGLHP